MNEPLLHIENLHKSFGRQRVLAGVDIDVSAGESVAIIGRSGSGKSVLLKHIIKLLVPDRGRIVFDGMDVGKINGRTLVEVRRRFGMLFQSAALFDSMTVAENVGLGLKESRLYTRDEIAEKVAEKLALVGLAEAGDKEPSELSGGMRKRAGLARAIADDPEVLLYDEPTTGLDPITADMIDDLIVELNKKLKVTSISVTHDMKSAFKIAGRIIMLFEGKVQFDGTPEALQKSTDPVVQQFITGRATGPIRVR